MVPSVLCSGFKNNSKPQRSGSRCLCFRRPQQWEYLTLSMLISYSHGPHLCTAKFLFPGLHRNRSCFGLVFVAQCVLGLIAVPSDSKMDHRELSLNASRVSPGFQPQAGSCLAPSHVLGSAHALRWEAAMSSEHLPRALSFDLCSWPDFFSNDPAAFSGSIQMLPSLN